MTKEDAQKLTNGVYRVFWKSGGCSVAAIGRNVAGGAWLAPANWVSVDSTGRHWRLVDRVELIAANGQSAD